MQIVLIEDEPLVASNLKKMLANLLPQATIPVVLSSVQAARTWLTTHPEPDLMFVDIQLSDGVSFDIFTNLPIRCPLIFTTAYNEYALRAFKLNSIDYLLKPIDPQELAQALDKFSQFYQKSPDLFQEQLARLLRDMQPTEPLRAYKERFMVQSRNRILPVAQEMVAYFYREEIIFLVTQDAQRHVAEFYTLEEVEHLINPALFFRANRQYIIQLHSVASFRPHTNGKLTVQLQPALNLELDISREKAQLFRQWLSGGAQTH